MLKTAETPPTSSAATQTFAWHGWTLRLPARWNPVKLEGDDRQGSALFADLHRPRLGMRWKVAGKKLDQDAWMKRAMRDEVGQLAAEAASPAAGGLLFVEPEPPGRDVFVVHSTVSNRVLQIVYHAHRRERILQEAILPTLRDLPREGEIPWAVFDLNCFVDARFKLVSHRLNAGELALSFAAGREVLNITQIALATIALRKMPIENWLAQWQGKHYSLRSEATEIASGVEQIFRRRRRFFYMRWIANEIFACAILDKTRDRLLLLSGSDRATVESTAASMKDS